MTKINEEPKIYAINREKNDSSITRKEFIKNVSVLGGSLFASSCATLYNSSTRYTNKMKVRQMKEVAKTYTLPCGSPIPSNAMCICNCVAASKTYSGTEMICTCDTITLSRGTHLKNNWTCVCNTVRTCTCNTICSCDSVSRTTYRPTYRTTYRSYWYPN